MTERAPTWIVVAVGGVLVITACLMTATAISLTADGPFNLVRIIATDEVFAPNARYLGSLVRQAPALAGLHLGVTDTYWLAVLLGIGYLVVPAAAWSVAVILSAEDKLAFAAVAVTAGITAVSTWFCSVSESVLALALTGIVSVLLWRSRPWGWGVAVLACGTSGILVASYETAIATSAIVGLWAAARARAATALPERIGCIVVAIASAAAIAVGFSGSFSGQNSSNSRSFAYFVVALEPGAVYVMLACGFLLVAALALSNRSFRTVLLLVSLSGALLAAASFDPTPSSAYAARGAAVIAVLALQCFLAARWVWRRKSPSLEGGRVALRLRWELAAPVVYVAALCAANLVALGPWTRGLDAFRGQVNARDGLVSVDDVLAPDRRRAVWGWTATSLSLVVRANADDAVLVDRDPSYVPFPPDEARAQIPDRYTWRR
jgi:hypothetical protein